MQIRRRELLVMLATGLTGCRPQESIDARRQSQEEETPPVSTTTPTASTTQAPATSQELSTTTAAPVRRIEVIERAGWGAAVAKPGMVEHTVERLTIHHTGVALEDNREAPSRVRAHQEFHQTDRGWPDLAYHFAIDRAGNVYEGRSLEFRGDTATSYDPTSHFLVVLEGNFDVEGTANPQLRLLTELLAWAAGRYSVGVDTIKSHRDYAPGETSCPGENVYVLLQSGDLVNAVISILDEEPIELVYLRGTEAIERVAAIESA